jgi:hypothetical protein
MIWMDGMVVILVDLAFLAQDTRCSSSTAYIFVADIGTY